MNVLQSIFKTISENLSFFSFEEEFSQNLYKRFSELAIFMHYASMDKDCRSYEGYAETVEHLAAKMKCITPDDVFKNFYTSYHIIMPYVFIRPHHRIDTLEKTLAIVCDGEFYSSEIPPHRQMEWNLMLYKLGRKKTLQAEKSSILLRNHYLPFVDRDLVYALTHAVFYLTDFGFRQKAPARIDIDGTAFRIACLVARFRAVQDVDVALELIISFLALYPFMQDRALAENLLVDSCLLADALLRETDFLNLMPQGEETMEELLDKKYHTLFVLGMLHALLKCQEAKTPLPQQIKETLLFADEATPVPTVVLDELAPVKASQIIEALKAKAYAKESYHEYRDNFGRSEHLEKEITFYLRILQKRNQEGILWNNEFEFLAVPAEQQAALQVDSHTDLEAKMCYA
ncbi:MAG TPA: hypothetical protein VFT64_07290 [Rickettsiales bacterium]|nr:hypothetical protein [Rickettsiales bacterium]